MTPEAKNSSLVQPAGDSAIALARSLLRTARYAALATLDPATGAPVASRVATATDTDGTPIILISTLAPHTGALKANSSCSLLVGEPGKGDPLAHPRMTLKCRADFVTRESDAGRRARRRYLNRHPKAALYADFADFSFVFLNVQSAGLNGGFAKAYALSTDHLLLDEESCTAVAEGERSAIEYMNGDHRDAIGKLADAAAGKNEFWSLTGLDPEGFDLARGDTVRRMLFPDPVRTPEDVRDAFIGMLKSTGNTGP